MNAEEERQAALVCAVIRHALDQGSPVFGPLVAAALRVGGIEPPDAARLLCQLQKEPALAAARDAWLQGGLRELSHESGRDDEGVFHNVSLTDERPGEPINGCASTVRSVVGQAQAATFDLALAAALLGATEHLSEKEPGESG